VTQAQDDRRLMAILFTDIAGYTTLTERDESTAIRVRERHRTLVRALASQFEGEVVDATGDESLSIFPSALMAVDCALALQAALRDDRDLAIRVGIHLGDVTRRGAEVIGEGVNVAARIRPLAEPGGIAISESVYQAVRTRSHIRATSLGAKALKNVTTPVNVFTLSNEPERALPSRRPRRLALALGSALVLVAGGWFVWSQYRVPILASIAIAAPRYFSNPVEQKLGFATTTDGVRIAYATTGSGPPLIFVLGWGTHLEKGFGSPLYDQFGWIAALSERSTLVRYDGRGFGMSSRDVTDYSLDARVRDLEAVVDGQKLERFAVYGISAGGPAAIAYTVRHPERVTRLVLIETSAGLASVALPPARAESMNGMLSLMRTSWDTPAVRDMWISVLNPSIDDVGRRVLNEFFRVAADGPAMAGFFTATVSEDVSSEAAAIRVPTLVIHGDKDTTVDFAYGVKLASLVPGARFEIIQGAGHEAFTDPRALKLVTEFLAQPD
jgi:pimeloyl-ACP methyl ester carboxylesterase/class 3 adenylate cyclase